MARARDVAKEITSRTPLTEDRPCWPVFSRAAKEREAKRLRECEAIGGAGNTGAMVSASVKDALDVH